MAPASKKQQTLATFFQKPSSSSNTSKSASSAARSQHSEDVELPDPKRRKLSSRETLQDDDHASALRPIPSNVQNSRTAPESPSKRTSKYLFSSSPLQENDDQVTDNDIDQRRKEDLHRRFVKKLGKPDSIADIKRRNKTLVEEDEAAQEDEDGEDEVSQPTEKPAGRSRATKKGSTKLTPMEKQVIEIKRAHMDTVLIVEVGYKFRFFGEDARVAAKELSIVCIPGKFRFDEHPSEAHLDRFASASIPVHRLHVHVKRLVAAGHKVGVVRQLETAALKAAGDNRNAPFIRKLTNLYTKGTYIDDTQGLDEESGRAPPQSPTTGFLLCMTETNVKGHGNDEKVQVGIVAVQPATGDVIYDDFEDGFMRSEIETRLLHIAPCEFLIVGELSRATEKLVMHLSGSKMNVFGDKVRVERVAKQKTSSAEAYAHISSFYADKLQDGQAPDGRATKLLDKILGLSEHVMLCLSAQILHMSEYGLENVFDLTKYFQPFSARSHMLLNGNTVTSLEIYQNQTDHSVKGSLFWTLDRTQTRFGGRLLRKWVGRPLLDKEQIEARLGAVEELLDADNAVAVERLRRVLANIRVDLEKNLLRIYYGKCTRPELLNMLQALQMLATEFGQATSASGTGFDSALITSVITSLPAILSVVVGYLDKINLQSAKSDDKYAFFRDDHETDTITEHKFGIASVEQDLDEFRKAAAEKLGKKLPVDYVSVAGIEYLIEVENSGAFIKKVPASWAKISGTKKVSRFHPPEVVKYIRERDQHKESLAAACDIAYNALLADISTQYQLLRDTILSVATLDCLLSFANIASQPGYVRPYFHSDTQLNITGARHPMIEQLLIDSYVPNNVSLSSASTRALLVTGPNMGGKSSYVRSVALIAIMAQIGSFVPAESANLGILDAVFTRMGAFDNMMNGESTFMVELSETSDILKLCTDRSLVVLDELGRGTSTHDGVAIASSVLDYLVREKKCLTLFITHYQVLARMAESFPRDELKNVHMRFSEEEAGSENITFLYEVGDGVAHRSYGLNVARLAGLAERVIDLAREESARLELEMRQRRLRGVARGLLENPIDGGVEVLVEGIEML